MLVKILLQFYSYGHTVYHFQRLGFAHAHSVRDMQRFSPIKRTKSDNYLPHIEGLRALALLGVILFHFEVHPFYGGYAGVDVFFTISGYLITRNIFLSYQNHNYFSLSQFYISRFRRLYPAAIITVLLTVIVSLTTVSKNAAEETAGAGLAAMFMSANTYFYLIDDYYAPSSIHRPLLHMWSLSLEEQFYLIWAPFIVFRFRVSKNAFPRMSMSPMIGMAIVSSLAFSFWAADNAAMFSFFHLPARMYQFAIGAFLASWQTSKITDNESRSCRNVRQSFQSALALIAFSVICLSYAFLPKRALSIAMLPVALATSALLALPNAAICKWLLSCKLAVFLGQLSYSAYLVHWPLYVHWRFVNLALSFDAPDPILVFLATIVLAKILKQSVEDSTRTNCKTHNVMVFIALVSLLALCLVSYKSVTGRRNSCFCFPLEPSRSRSCFSLSSTDRKSNTHSKLEYCVHGRTPWDRRIMQRLFLLSGSVRKSCDEITSTKLEQ